MEEEEKKMEEEEVQFIYKEGVFPDLILIYMFPEKFFSALFPFPGAKLLILYAFLTLSK